jgi:hypothetical protein
MYLGRVMWRAAHLPCTTGEGKKFWARSAPESSTPEGQRLRARG